MTVADEIDTSQYSEAVCTVHGIPNDVYTQPMARGGELELSMGPAQNVQDTQTDTGLYNVMCATEGVNSALICNLCTVTATMQVAHYNIMLVLVRIIRCTKTLCIISSDISIVTLLLIPIAENSAILADRFADHVSEMHLMRDKGFEEEFKVSKSSIIINERHNVDIRQTCSNA